MTSRQVRLLIEAVVIVAVAAGVGLAQVGRNATYAAVAVAWIAIAFVEYRLSRR
jgi:hypothetical protein